MLIITSEGSSKTEFNRALIELDFNPPEPSDIFDPQHERSWS